MLFVFGEHFFSNDVGFIHYKYIGETANFSYLKVLFGA